jgi:peroxiredoxin
MDTLISPGMPAPDFTLPGLDGVPHRLQELRGRIAILNFWSAECPWSRRADGELLTLLPSWGEQVVYWAIACNRNESPELLLQAAKERRTPSVLVDARQQVADLYGAQATPHIFVIDIQGRLAYMGALDNATFRQQTPTRLYLQEAVQALLNGRHPDPSHTLAYGCAIVRE